MIVGFEKVKDFWLDSYSALNSERSTCLWCEESYISLEESGYIILFKILVFYRSFRDSFGENDDYSF